MSTEADTCRTLILPKLYAAGWSDDQISEQRSFTDGRIVVHGNRAVRKKGKRADYILRRTSEFCLQPLASLITSAFSLEPSFFLSYAA